MNKKQFLKSFFSPIVIPKKLENAQPVCPSMENYVHPASVWFNPAQGKEVKL